MQLNLSTETFLVTGGCGFIGSNIVQCLVENNVGRCIVVDNLFTGNQAFLPKSPKVTFVQGSITDEKILEKVLPSVTRVISCAAVNIIAAQTDPFKDLDVNARGTLLLTRTCSRYKNIKQFVYTSTASVYGNPEYLPIPEHSRLRPMSCYAVSKLAGENYTMLQYLLEDLPAVVVRYSNVYGPNQSPRNPYSGVVAKFIESAFQHGVIRIHGNGQQTRDFTFVDDAVEATIMASMTPKAEGSIFNVAAGTEISIHDLGKKIFELLQLPTKFEMIDKRDIDNISRRCLNIEEIRTRLKWEPRFNLNEGLQRTIHWFRSSGLIC